MKREIHANQKKIVYDLCYKDVKNINMRVKSDGRVRVSANKRVPLSVIDAFVASKADWIFRTAKRYERPVCEPFFTEEEIKAQVLSFCKKAYPYYEKRGIARPEIRFRTMVSRWGSCHAAKGVLTFNLNLRYAPLDCTEYVVWHEFTHFLHQNHQKEFYEELSKVFPDWKRCRARLKEVHLT